jgi:hypothetical protein
MSALAEALVAAQRRALSAMEKQYAAGKLEPDAVREKLTAIGLTDDVDADRLIAALDLIREYGAPLPQEADGNGKLREMEPASDAQLALIADLVKRNKLTAPDLPVTKVDASAIISSMKAGTYDAAKWTVPF